MFLTLSEALVNRERLFYGVMRSLSAEEEERQVLAAMIDSCTDPIVMITTQGVIERANPACTKVFGYTKEELIGGNVTMLMPQPHATNHQTYIDNYLKKSHKSEHAKKSCPSHVIGKGREVAGRTKSGQEFPIFLSVSEFHVRSTKNSYGLMQEFSAGILAGTCQAVLLCPLEVHRANRIMEEELKSRQFHPLKNFVSSIKEQLAWNGSSEPEERRKRALSGVKFLQSERWCSICHSFQSFTRFRNCFGMNINGN